ncbi:MAG: single-stranded-DNA-specific exonuclease RecJ, partial [Desulfobulbus propionicus]
MVLQQGSQIESASPEVQHLCQRFAAKFNLPLALARILYDRGYSTEKEVETFLYPSFAELPKPDLMLGIQETVSIVLDAWHAKKEIIIHGDYDVDGVTSTTLMVTFFRSLGLFPRYYIPNRLTDSYGFTNTSVDNIIQLLQGKQGLVITVDCGISSVDAVEYAQEQGIEVVITDHHQPPAELPRASAIVNPKQPGCNFPFKQLSGVGVAFFVIAAIRRAFISRGFWASEAEAPQLKSFLDLVALGTVADVMPLTGVNRILVRAGLEIVNQKQRVGIYALCEQCGMYQNDAIRAEEISFKLAPRLNAAGRMGQSEHAVQLLLAENYKAAKKQAVILEGLNTERRALENAVLDEIYTDCEEFIEQGDKGLVIYHKTCHPGVLGIIAARVVERFHCPAIVVTEEQADEQG